MPNTEKIIRCMYAGDPQDEYCQHCDGYHPVDDNGKPQNATDCGGYEPCNQEEPQAQLGQEQSVPEATAHKCEGCPTTTCEGCADAPVAPKVNTNCAKGITTVIRAESGLTREVNGTYFKFMFSEERILPEGCDIEAEKQALWDSVNAEVDAQLEAVKN